MDFAKIVLQHAFVIVTLGSMIFFCQSEEDWQPKSIRELGKFYLI